MTVRFLHTADWQIGKAFAKLPDESAVPLREQRITTIKKIAALAKAQAVDAVLVAGDVFEFESLAEKTLHQTLRAMAGFEGMWILIPGNHDPGTPESVWQQLRRLGAPSNIVLADKPQAIEIPGKNAVVLTAPLQRRHEPNDLTQWFDQHKTEPNIIRIGLAHGSVDNRLPDRGEAPNTISDKRPQQADLDYLALGDWHGMLCIDKKIWYSGTHETDRFRDNESGNVLLVEIEEHGAQPKVIPHRVGHYRWRQVTANIDGDTSAQEIDRVLNDLGGEPEDLVVQLTLQGMADLETRAQIDRTITKWSGLVRYLEVREEALVSRASETDVEQIGRAGFIGETVKRLKSLAEDADNPEREIAEAALNMLFLEHKQLVNKR